jgi:iron-sulfur cluster assembly protein
MNAPLRARPAILSMTDAASARVRALLANAGEGAGLRLGIKKGGCAGMEYAMALAEAPEKGDEVVDIDGARVFVEPAALMFLLGVRMDYRTDRFTSGFTFQNPNQTSACGCGESVSLRPAERAGD